MPELDWDETDFMVCLEVVPEVKEYGVQHLYRIEKDGMTLVVIVKQYDSLVWFSLSQLGATTPLIEFDLYVRGGIKYLKDKRGEALEFSDSILTSTRSATFWSSRAFEKNVGEGLLVRLTVKPSIQIAFV